MQVECLITNTGCLIWMGVNIRLCCQVFFHRHIFMVERCEHLEMSDTKNKAISCLEFIPFILDTL